MHEIILALLRKIGSERSHAAIRNLLDLMERIPGGIRFLQKLFLEDGIRFTDSRLAMRLPGLFLDGPCLVGAGWTKTGQAIGALYALGFSGIEFGAVLLLSQPGNNYRPRQLLLKNGTWNALGFNARPLEEVLENIRRYRSLGIPIGVNIGLNKDITHELAQVAYVAVALAFYSHVAWLTFNPSSPNTKDLRQLQQKEALRELLRAGNEVRVKLAPQYGWKPMFVKVSPDISLNELDDVVELCSAFGWSLIIGNTTTNPEIKKKYGLPEYGGYAGRDPSFRCLSNNRIAHVYRQTRGKMVVIGCGGAYDLASVCEKLLQGASAVQIVSGIPLEGLGVADRINHDLAFYLDHYQIKNIRELIGAGI
jgi:dihydroorotate dehydrogenase